MRHRLSRGATLAVAGAIALLGTSAGVTVASAGKRPKKPKPHVTKKVTAADQLAKINHFVVVYQENHSFDNLCGGWEGVRGTGDADPSHTTQINQAGKPFSCLLQNDVNLASPPLTATCSDATTATPFSSRFSNGRFALGSFIPATATTCPAPGAFYPNGVLAGTGLPGGCTRDLVHRFYQEQYQLNGGAQNRYATGSDAVGLVMGLYDTTALPVYAYLHAPAHPPYAIADDFFQGAFGGSFLNHQWLVAAAAPVFKNAVNDGSTNDLHSVVDANGMPSNYPLYASPLGTAVKDQALTASCAPGPGRPATPPGVTCGDYAVNTTQSSYQPYSPGTPDSRKLPPLTNPTIGERLSAAGSTVRRTCSPGRAGARGSTHAVKDARSSASSLVSSS